METQEQYECPQCDNDLVIGEPLCRNCGVEIDWSDPDPDEIVEATEPEEFLCPGCGHDLVPGESLCRSCGIGIEWEADGREARPLGGMLIVVGSLLIINPILFAYTYAYNQLPVYAYREEWISLLPHGMEGYNHLWTFAVLTEIFMGTVTLLFSVVLIVYFLGKRNQFPGLMLIYMVILLGFKFTTILLLQAIPPVLIEELFIFKSELAALLVSVILWTVYLSTSKRVVETFVN